jgi:predicted nucleic acid-binding protein
MEPGASFCCPRFIFSELFKHKERIVAATELPEEELLDTLNSLFAHIQFVDESAIPIGDWLEARRLCAGVDDKDAPFVALAIYLKARLWTEDGELKKRTSRQRVRFVLRTVNSSGLPHETGLILPF